jgi:2-dehydropantoate 2-reductase
MKFNNIIVLGAGIIGSCYGALLSARHEVLMLDNKEIVDKIKKKGLTVTGDREKRYNPAAQTKLDKILPNTLILLTTKAHQAEAAIQGIKNLLRTDTVILILQNGIGNEDIIKNVIGDKGEVIRGIVNIGAWENETGCYNLVMRETVLAPARMSETITRIFNEAGLATRIGQDFIAELWQKLALNCVLNPLTAILRVRNNQIGVPVLKQLRHQIIEECKKVGKAEGIILNANLSETLDRAIQKYPNFSSMYQDVINGKKTEIDFLTGRIVEIGKKHNIPTPINESLYAIVKFMESKYETS